MRDKGLNTTPTWLALVEPLANAFPAGGAGWWLLLYSDFMLLVAALALVCSVKGLQTASLMSIFLLTWIGTTPQLMGHWFQYLWLVLCLISAVAWHKKWFAVAGAALALAAALRIFPAVFFVWPLLHWRKIPRRFWVAAIATGAAAVLVGSFTSLGWEAWPVFMEKMMIHSSHLAGEPGNFGLRNLITTAINPAAALATWKAFALGNVFGPAAESSPTWSWAMVAVAAALAALAAKKQPKMSFSSGLPLLFSGLVVSRYYYASLVFAFDGSSRKEAATLLAISLLFVVLLYWLHPVISYTVGQVALLIFLYWRVNKWT